MATPLFPTFEKRITDSVNDLIAAQVIPWSFLTAGPPLRLKRFDGRKISYQGVTFEGTTQDVFWRGYIEPFLEDLVVRELAFAVESCKERKVDARETLRELQGLLLSGCSKVFAQMADVDRRLRGHGYPDSVPLRSVKSEQDQMTAFIQTRVSAELELWESNLVENHPPEAEDHPLNAWHRRNPGKAWALAIVIGSVISLGIHIHSQFSKRMEKTEKDNLQQGVVPKPPQDKIPPVDGPLEGKPAPHQVAEGTPAHKPQAIPDGASKPILNTKGTARSRQAQRDTDYETIDSTNMIDPSTQARKKDQIDQLKAAWVKAHLGIISRYREGKTGKVEIESAIQELELIEQAAADINDHRSKHWADQEKLNLQLIDVPPLH
jgi:hypothetical protein